MKPRVISCNSLGRVMRARGHRQDTLAKKVGVTEQTVRNWLIGKTSPSAKSLQRLVEVLEVDVGEITVING